MKTIITIQHTQSIHHTNGMVGSWTDWELSELGKHMGINPILRRELRERNLGKYVGKSVQWLRENLECQEKTVDDRLFSDAESRRDEWNRLKPFFEEIISNDEKDIIIVWHGDLLSVFNAMWLGLGVESLNHFELFGLSGGISYMF